MKPVETIVLDAGPILQNNPAVSTLIMKSEKLVTTPSVISEIRDINARTRIETTLIPFLTMQTPSLASIKFVSDFTRRTGDLQVLSKTDLEILALAYELDCQRHGGDARLRKVPGQKLPVPPKPKLEPSAENTVPTPEGNTVSSVTSEHSGSQMQQPNDSPMPAEGVDSMTNELQELQIEHLPNPSQRLEPQTTESKVSPEGDSSQPPEDPKGQEDSDPDDWITPSNIKKHQAADEASKTVPTRAETVLPVATLTTDYAMQNVLLQIGLNLISPSLRRIRNVRTYILRCHACFEKVKDISKQFCPRCGKPTLTRVTCSTNVNGEFTVHLKKNMQWNHRGDRYSIPKPTSGSSSGKVGQGRGGGKGGWGQQLILAEDQKEYQRAVSGQARNDKKTDLMDQDYLPGILTGERSTAKQRPRVGAGRNVNSKKRV